mmetsp:Transcript_3136/g.5055  ORF Transcript_3136/g.5055 Transcript_3136/m.5055 type:complete len:245 (+) Transcript_3136:2-736(+)
MDMSRKRTDDEEKKMRIWKHEQMEVEMGKLHAMLSKLNIWQIHVQLPWKTGKAAQIEVDVDAEFTIMRVKASIQDAEGVHPEQQRLWLIKRHEDKHAKPVWYGLHRAERERLKQEAATKKSKVLLDRDSATLASYNIGSGDVLQVELDEEVTKRRQTAALLDELGHLTEQEFNDKIRAAFSQFDIDGSGNIEGDEIGLTMKSLGIYLTDQEIQRLIQRFDVDGDAQIDLEEFMEMVRIIMRGEH